ncbi:MAG: hypothetical protein EBX50_08830 [Chitinophagia bacterium]|nr:hypothetical protein [Chitinophagia bacterium]
MQLINLTLGHYYFYSPSTGGVILDGDICHDNEPSLMGYWLDEFWQEPHINDDKLKKHWNDYLNKFNQLLENQKSLNEFHALEQFFKELEFTNAVVFKITDHFPQTPTGYFIIDFNVTN